MSYEHKQAPQLLPKEFIPLIRARSARPDSATASAETKTTLPFSAADKRRAMRRLWQEQRQQQSCGCGCETYTGNAVQARAAGPASVPTSGQASTANKRHREE